MTQLIGLVRVRPMNMPLQVTNGSSMPVCRSASGKPMLHFITDVEVVLELPDGFKRTLFQPAGSSWDGATIPFLFWWIIGHPLSPKFRWASFWHDRSCETAKTYEERRLADAVFLYLLSQESVPKIKRMAMWLGVRLYGLLIWKPKVSIP